VPSPEKHRVYRKKKEKMSEKFPYCRDVAPNLVKRTAREGSREHQTIGPFFWSSPSKKGKGLKKEEDFSQRGGRPGPYALLLLKRKRKI